MTNLEKYYNKFKEDHRLTTRHGTVEFTTSMKYIHDFLPQKENKDIKILDIGAGTGRYSIALCHQGFDVTAVELVKHNLDILQSKHEKVKSWLGSATNLSFLQDDTFDVTLIFGPMYHLISKEEKIKALNEAKRVTKKDGIIFIVYIMNDYSIITYCFKQKHIKECLERNSLTKDFKQIPTEDDLYHYVRLEDINELNEICNLERIKIVAQDGASDYIRRELNALTPEEFDMFIQYHLSTCEKPELLGASSHLLDIVRNTK